MADNAALIAANAAKFLSRVDLKGGEVPAFVEVINWLAELQNAPEAADDQSDAAS